MTHAQSLGWAYSLWYSVLLFLPVLYETLKIHVFTKMAVSPLILVRFEKFEIVCTQDFGPDVADVRMTLRATRRAR